MTLKRMSAILVLLMLGLALPLLAQSDRATITGTLTDTTSALLPGVTVRVTNQATNEVQETTTNGLGTYRISDLPVGTYTVSFSKAGFQTQEEKGVVLLISQVAELDAHLKVGGTSEVVQVTSAAPILQTEDSAVSTNLNAEAVSELPLNVQGSRNLSNFMFAYVPGVEGSDYSSHIDGSMALTKEVLIDGTSAVSQLGGYISESQPPMEAVQEYESDTSGISSDAGRSGGGVFKYELKSGANQYHGTLFGFMHSTDLDALSASNKLIASQYAQQGDTLDEAASLRKSDSLSDWGGSFGGAIIKDKLFYYGAFERYMQSMWSTGANSRIVPTDAMMGLDSSGNTIPYADLSPMLTTSQYLTTDGCDNAVFLGSIYNPSTGCVFVNNQIPTSMISAKTSQILQLYHKYYEPDSQTLLGGADEPGPSYQPDPWFHNTQSSVKIDYNLNQTNHINGSFYWDYYPRINADQGGVWSATAPYGGPMANSYWHDTTAPGARLSYEHTVNANLINTAYATFNRFRNPSIAVSESGKWDSQLGLINGAGNFPLIYFDTGEYTNGANYQNGWAFSSLGSQYNDYYAGNTFIYSDQLDWSHGRHNVKGGVEYRAMQFNYHTDVGTFTGGYPIIFDPSTTAGFGYQQTGNAFASFLLGDVYNAESNNPDNEYGRRKAFSWYLSDDIKVNQRLTVNLSLRWDWNNPYKEKYGHWSSFELNDLNPITGLPGTYEYLTKGSQSFERRQDPYNYAPHLGVAYKLTNKTVVRGNFAVFFTPLNMNTWGGIPYQQSGNVGFHAITQEHGFEWDGGYNPAITPNSAYNAAYQGADMISIDPRSLTPGNTWQYNVGVQRELDSKTKVDANWIQSRSTHLQSGIFETNQPKFTDYQNYVISGAMTTDPNGYYSWACPGANGNDWWCITPYPQAAVNYSSMFSVDAPLGNADYRSFQLSFTRRSNKGLSFLGSYNWSQTHGDIDSDFQELWGSGSLQNIYDLKDEAKSISDFDITHIVKGYVIYNLPFGRGKALLSNVNHTMNAIVSGWSLNGDFHYSTGSPITVRSTNSYPGFSSVYIDMVPGCKLTNGKPKLNQVWLNYDCFANPDPGVGWWVGYSPRVPQLGTAPAFFSNLRNPGLATEDLGLHKSLAVGPDGKYAMSLRLEFFNVFNRDALAGPNTNYGDPQNFGLVSGYGGVGGRVGQFGARFAF